MSVQPRSQVLVQISANGTNTTNRFTCPAGCITLVKGILCSNIGAAALQLFVGVGNTTMSHYVYLVNQSIATNAMFSWSGWFVLNPTDWVEVDMTASPTGAVWVSGAVLSGGPLHPPNQ